MNVVEIFENNKKVLFPSTWDELNPKQICFIFKTFDRCLKKGKSPLEFNVRILYHLLGIKRSWWNSPSSQISENVYLLCEQLLTFLFKEENARAVLSFNSLKNPLPVVKCGLFRLLGPSDMLSDLTFGAFRHAAIALNLFFQSNLEEDLNECIAYLYRKRSNKPDRAGRYAVSSEREISKKDLRLVKKLKSWQKNLIMLWFSACLQYLQSGMVIIDGEDVDMSKLFLAEDTSDVSFNWNDLLVEIAKEQSIGPIDRVDEEPLFSILGIMWHNYKERKRDEAIRKS